VKRGKATYCPLKFLGRAFWGKGFSGLCMSGRRKECPVKKRTSSQETIAGEGRTLFWLGRKENFQTSTAAEMKKREVSFCGSEGGLSCQKKIRIWGEKGGKSSLGRREEGGTF